MFAGGQSSLLAHITDRETVRRALVSRPVAMKTVVTLARRPDAAADELARLSRAEYRRCGKAWPASVQA